MAMMSTKVKYRGCIQVTHWQPSTAQPRPGILEANNCVKRIMDQTKQSTEVLLSCSPKDGLKCEDARFTPAKIIMRSSVYEIAHCGVDVSRPRLFTCIIGTKGENAQFFCHVFKCESKDAASQVTRAVAAVCTEAFQNHKQAPQAQPQRAAAPQNAPSGKADPATLARQQRMRRQSLKKAHKKPTIQAKLTDDWFTPDMSRDTSTAKLQKARVGDFLVRESKSKPGDYAIGVQTGKNLWTGLILQSADGFQLGNSGNDLFDELTDLISHYMCNSFMNDDFGYPLMLRLPIRQEQQQKARQAAQAPPPVQQQAYTPPAQQYAPPAQQYAPPAQQYAPPAQEAAPPTGGWPGDDVEGMSEFEKFMDSAECRQETDDGGVAAATAGVASMGGGDFNPRAAAPPPRKTLQSQATAIFSSCTSDAEACVSGAEIRPILMKSGLSIGDLGKIWMEVDQSRRGKVDCDQLALILGLMGQAQSGQAIALEQLDPATATTPTVEGF